MSNFAFLKERWPILENLGRLAERNLYIDSNTTFIKCGMFGEIVVKYMFSMEEIDDTPIIHDNNHNNRIKLLKKEDLIPDDIDNILHLLRIKRNNAAHSGYDDTENAKIQLELTYKLAVWFMQTYGDWDFQPEPYEEPSKNPYGEDIGELTRTYEEKYKKLEAELERLRAEEKDEDEIEHRKAQGQKASRNIELNEAETRKLIDAQLQDAGWEADTINLKYSNGTRPQKNRNMAIAEWPTDAYSVSKKNGRVDYALFIGEKLVGFVEAKRFGKDVAGVITEAKDYAESVKEEHSKYVIFKRDNYKVPFLFSTNGRKYIKEIEEKSGIHFLDCRDARNNSEVLHGWYSPDNLMDMLSKDIEESNKELDEMSFEYMMDKNSIGLRYYQVDAIKAVEKAIKDGKESALITMATGTGKTRTVLGLIYRLLKTKRYKRILFLVDRTTLGDQALDTFKEVKIEDLKTLNQIYNINGLNEKLIEKETKIHISTVQAMVKRILYSDDADKPTVGDYDCIIVDEAHRGYILDRGMTDSQIEWRDERDFISKYKRVIEYFNAFKVALTATPALHTTAIFGEPVYNYTYRNAVIDGYLVDHEPPHIIETLLAKDGIHYKKGDNIAKINKYTGELINGGELSDDVDFEVDQFNKKIVVEAHTRAALEEVAKYIDPENDMGKTLIFAASDLHADMIVRLLKEIYKETIGGVDDNSILKITGSIKNPEDAIKQFKNEKYPNVVVTVDLLSTGVDVPKIDKIVFLRRVKSRILYEQMLGRATRLCDEINKTHFEIFDCVGVYDALKDVTNMKPVASNEKTSFKLLIETLERTDNEEEKEATVNRLIAKLQRKKKLIDDSQKLIFKSLCDNKTPEEFIKELQGMSTEEATQEIINHNSLMEYLDEKYQSDNVIFISDKKDKVISHTRGYGKGKKPEDYIQEFNKYIEENRNTIQALEVVCTKPEDLTKESLKQLKAVLDNNGFNEEYLKAAYKDMNHVEIVADIIAFVRQQALGSPLESNEVRVERAMKKIRSEYQFTRTQENWLKRIEDVMLRETVIDKSTLDTGSFKTQGGGFSRLNKIFGGKLEEIIDKAKKYMFDSKEIS